MRQASRYSIGGRPTVRVKRSKNAERESAAVFASWATVHERASWPCICRIAGASRASANPRSSPGGASSPGVDRSASMSSTSTSRVSTRSRPDLRSLDSSPTSRTSDRQPLDAAHVHQRRQQRHQQRRVGRVEDEAAAEQPHVGTATARAVADFARRARRHLRVDAPGLTGSKPDIVKPGVAGRSTKSPASSVSGTLAVDGETAAALRARRRSSAGRRPSSGHPSGRRR